MTEPTRKRLGSISNTPTERRNIRRQVDQTVEAIQSSLLQRSASELENIIGAPAATSASSSERPSSKKKQKPSVACNNFLEHDGIRPCDSELSVGTKIKRECLKKYPRYKTLDDQGKALVALGANSILDLTNPNSAHQELFSSQEWKDLSHQFRPMFENNTALLEENNSSLREIEKLAREDLDAARLKANKLESGHKGALSTLYDMYSEYLKIIQFRKRVFRPDIDVTEGDLTVKVWGPLLECIMRDEDDLRLKWGESVGDSAGAVEGNTGFKVDVRAVRDNFSALRNRRESDAANVELARVGASLGKMFGDKMKLLVESKCVVDRTVKDSNPEKIVAVPAMQITGLHAGLFSVRLGAPGLYVAVSEGTCQLPKTADMLRDLREAYVLLRKFKDASVNLSNAAIYGNRSDHSKKDDLRDTWMPPRSGTRISPLPKYMLESVEESSI